MTAEQTKLVVRIMNDVIATIEEVGEVGSPGGVLYAAMMAQGASLNQFNGIMNLCVQTGKIEKRGDCYYPTYAKAA